MQEDAHLVEQALIGDEQEFHRLIIKYYPSIYVLILSKIKNTEDAKDILQDVFLESYQGLRSLRQPDKFNSWLRQIAKNHCQNWISRNHDNFTQLHENIADETLLADELLILRETLAKVMKAIDELPELESRLLKERYLDDVSYDELETRHGLSYNALAMRLHRAKQRVREKINRLSSWTLFYPEHFIKGGIEAMKIGVKAKIISFGVAGILVLGGTGVIVWHNLEQSTSINSIDQVVENPKTSINQSPVKKTVSGNMISKSVNESRDLSAKSKQDKKVSEATANSETTESNKNIPVERKTPSEILKKYNAIMSSPEFMAEARNILVSGRMKMGADEKRIEELKNKEKELENNLQISSEDKRSDIENELAKTKDEIWETRINMQKQAILDDDSYQKLKLKYITVEEIRVAQQELRKTRPSLSGNSEEDNTEEGKLNSMARNEAVKRLKADGWTPNPLRSYQ